MALTSVHDCIRCQRLITVIITSHRLPNIKLQSCSLPADIYSRRARASIMVSLYKEHTHYDDSKIYLPITRNTVNTAYTRELENVIKSKD